MLSETIKIIIEKLRSGGQSAPLLVSEETACEIIHDVFWADVSLLTDIEERGVPDCLLYDCADKDTKKHKVEFVRKFVEHLYHKPGWDILVALFLNIDALADHSYNALLKVFEDVPQRLLILITSQTPEKIIPTLQSRIVTLDSDSIQRAINPYQADIDAFVSGRPESLFNLTLGKEFKKEQALWIVTWLQNAILNGTLSPRYAKHIRETRLNLETTNTIAKYLIDKLLISLLCE